MRKAELQCLIVGQSSRNFTTLEEILRMQESHVNFKHSGKNKPALISALKRLNAASMIFICRDDFRNIDFPRLKDEISENENTRDPFDSLQNFTDLVWQYASDASVVILDQKPSLLKSTAYTLNDIQINHLYIKDEKQKINQSLNFLIQSTQLKYDLRNCKRLLGISEKRCQWLLDSSKEPVAFISRDLHLYANSAYLELFKIASVQSLRSVPVKDFIDKQEWNVFDGFVRDQIKHPNISQNLFLNLQRADSSEFRARIKLIPSVLRGKRCFQLWVYALNNSSMPKAVDEISLFSANDRKNDASDEIRNLWNVQNKQTETQKTEHKTMNIGLILQEILKRKEARIFTRPITSINYYDSKSNTGKTGKEKNIRAHYFFTGLKVPYIQRKAVDDLLAQSTTDDVQLVRSLFWDRVKLTRLFQIIFQKPMKPVKLVVRISESSLHNKQQLLWLQNSLKKLQLKSSMFIFLLPSRLDETGQKACVEFIHKFKPFGCQFALDDFYTNSASLSLLKHIKPDLVVLSLPWIRSIEGDDQREIALGKLIRHMELKQIKIIVPCGFSTNMRKLFILSGASFCQENTAKNA